MNSMNGNMGFGNTGQMTGKRGAGPGDIVPKRHRIGQMQQFTPEQMQLLSQMMSNVGPDSYLSRLAGGDESLFEEMEAPAMRQFQGLLGDMGSRFSGMGMGARRGSGFQNQTTQAASDFAQDLASKRQGLQRQAIMDLQGISHSLMNERPYDRFMVQKQAKQQGSGWGSLAGGIVGGGAGALFGGPMGALAGANIGSNTFSGF